MRRPTRQKGVAHKSRQLPRSTSSARTTPQNHRDIGHRVTYSPDPHGAQKMVLLSHSAPRSMATRPAGGFPLLGSLVSGGHLGV